MSTVTLPTVAAQATQTAQPSAQQAGGPAYEDYAEQPVQPFTEKDIEKQTEPVQDWLKSLDGKARADVIAGINTLNLLKQKLVPEGGRIAGSGGFRRLQNLQPTTFRRLKQP